MAVPATAMSTTTLRIAATTADAGTVAETIITDTVITIEGATEL
jgi:hypothetical protein